MNPLNMDQLYYLVGKGVVTIGLIMLIASLFGSILIIYSFKTNRFFFARFMHTVISMLESVIKYIFWFARADTAVVDDVGVQLKNYINHKKFQETPISAKTIFLPQCLRSTECPAKLTPEGIVCVNCGRCEIGEAKNYAQDLGYSFFIVPGSSFIKRIIEKYSPQGIIGVGCQMEVKEGLDLCNSIGIPTIGIPLSTAGCVATTLDWDLFYKTISAGRDRKYQVRCKKGQ